MLLAAASMDPERSRKKNGPGVVERGGKRWKTGRLAVTNRWTFGGKAVGEGASAAQARTSTEQNRF